MKKIIAMTTIGLAIAAITGCSSTNTTAANQQQSAPAKQDQGQSTQKKGQHKGQADNQELLSLLKIDSNTLQEDFKAGKSLADIAAEKGVPEQQVIDLLVKQSAQRTDEAVKSGKLTQDKADQMKAKEPDRIKKSVEHKGGMGGQRPQGKPQDNTDNSNSQSTGSDTTKS
jgi:hypothetical protein